ncbi:hypothetical protein RSAG8_06829, partial [Rhizoctonia solani AG-8 WAC10335]
MVAAYSSLAVRYSRYTPVSMTPIQIQASLIFGSRPATPHMHKDFNSTYTEDVFPNLPNSSDSHPIELQGITVNQFRRYLLAITSRPGDEYYKPLYRQETKLCIIYLDTAILAGRFGMTGLEGWAMDALLEIFGRPRQTLADLALEDWGVNVLLQLIATSRDTELYRPMITFVQYFVSVSVKEMARETINKDKQPGRPGAPICVRIYNAFKGSNSDPAMFGFVFLSLFSLGHRSSIWSSSLTGRDRAIFYAAQAQLVDTTKELQCLKWLQPHPTFDSQTPFCPQCKLRLTTLWKQGFGGLSQALGSGLPPKDVSVLSSLPRSYWRFRMEWDRDSSLYCERGFGSSDWGAYNDFLHSLEGNMQNLFEEVASRYGTFARYMDYSI